MKPTDDLWNEMLNTDTVDEFVGNNLDDIVFNGLEEMFDYFKEQKKLRSMEVYDGAMISRTFGRQIITGERGATRDKIIQFCFGLKLDLEEAQRFIKISGNRELYLRDLRDSVIIFAIKDGKSLLEANLELERKKLRLLV